MKNGMYESRAEQIEADLRRLLRDLKKEGFEVSRPIRKLLREFAKNVAFSGACGERDHCLAIVRTRALNSIRVEKEITGKSITEVLGYVAKPQKEPG